MSFALQGSAGFRRRRGGRWTLVFALTVLLLVGASVAWRFWREAQDRQAWRDACAQADALDPGWRYEDLVASLPDVPHDRDSAKHALTAAALVPEWANLGIRNQKLNQECRRTLAQIRYSTAVVAGLRDLLHDEPDAIAAAKLIADCPSGRMPNPGPSLSVREPSRSMEFLRVVKGVLLPQLLLRAEDGDIDGAIDSLRAIIYLSRPLFDSPALIDNLVGEACRVLATQGAERILAQGEASPDALDAMLQILNVELRRSALLQGIRAQRAAVENIISEYDAGRLTDAEVEVGLGFNAPAVQTGWPFVDRLVSSFLRHGFNLGNVARRMELETWMIECLKESPDGVVLHGPEFDARRPEISSLGLATPIRFAMEVLSDDAPFRCAVAGFAAERFRRDRGRWPTSLSELVPSYLPLAPTDPFDLKPLRLAECPDGIVIYSIGINKADDGGAIAQGNPPGALDVGIRLWDVGRRRQSPKTAHTSEGRDK